jgi:hypothetical protein
MLERPQLQGRAVSQREDVTALQVDTNTRISRHLLSAFSFSNFHANTSVGKNAIRILIVSE